MSVSQGFLVHVSRDEQAGEDVSGWLNAGLVVRVVRGRKMESWSRLLDEFSAAWQFPRTFGENLDAFSDCITDLGWLDPQAGYVIVITEPECVLTHESDDALRKLICVLADANDQWAQSIEDGEWWDRGPIPFHVILQPKADNSLKVKERWTTAGAAIQSHHS